jgi:Domain of unknown function (DUF6249)
VITNLPTDTDAANLTALASAVPHADIAAILGLSIPILAVVLGLSMGMLSLYFDFRKKREMFQLHHAERMAAIEKGIDVPPLPPEFFGDYKRRVRSPTFNLQRGWMWLLIGLAVTIALFETGQRDAWWGLVPMAVGVAYLLSYLIDRRTAPTPPNPYEK